MSNRPVSLQSLPSIADLYVKSLEANLDGTKRSVINHYDMNYQSMPLSAQPLDGENKIRVGIEYSKETYQCYTTIDYDGLFDVGDLFKFRNKWFTVKEVLGYREGPEIVQHVKFIMERLPVPPKGLV